MRYIYNKHLGVNIILSPCGDWRWRFAATLVACMAETPCWSVGCEFRRQVVALFLSLPFSSCVVRKARTSYTSLHNTYWLHIATPYTFWSCTYLCSCNTRYNSFPSLALEPPLLSITSASSWLYAEWNVQSASCRVSLFEATSSVTPPPTHTLQNLEFYVKLTIAYMQLHAVTLLLILLHIARTIRLDVFKHTASY